MRFSPSASSSSSTRHPSLVRPVTISVPLHNTSTAELTYDIDWSLQGPPAQFALASESTQRLTSYPYQTTTAIAVQGSVTAPDSSGPSNSVSPSFSTAHREPSVSCSKMSHITAHTISQPTLVAGSAFGFSPDSFESSSAFSSPPTPTMPDSPQMFHATSSSPDTLKAIGRDDIPPQVVSYQHYQANKRSSLYSLSSFGQQDKDREKERKGSIRLSRPAIQAQPVPTNSPPLTDLKHIKTMSDSASKRISRFPWKRTSMSGLQPSNALDKQPKARHSIMNISAPVLEYSTSELVSDSRLTMILNSNGHPPPPSSPNTNSNPNTDPRTNSLSSSPRDLSSKPVISLAVHTSFQKRTSLASPRTANVTAPSPPMSHMFPQSPELSSELKLQLQESENRRRNVLIEYQQKLDSERKRTMALQKQLEELSSERATNIDQLAKLKQLQSQRDVLRKALVTLRETKDMELKEYRDKLGRDIVGAHPAAANPDTLIHKPQFAESTPQRSRTLIHSRSRPLANTNISTVGAVPTLSVSSSLSSYSLASEAAAPSRPLHRTHSVDFFSAFKVGISPLLPIGSPVEIEPRKLRESVEIVGASAGIQHQNAIHRLTGNVTTEITNVF